MSAANGQPRHLRWPAERFYWAVLDGASVGGGTSSAAGRRRLGYLFESVLPGVPIDDVHAVYRKLPGGSGRYLACGVARSALEEVGASTSVTLTPETLPPFVDEPLRSETINLLTGTHAPRPVRRLGAVWTASIALLLVAAAALVIVRLERTVRVADAELAAIESARQGVFEQVLGPGAATSVLPPEQLLVAERRRLEQTRQADVAGAELIDCSVLLGRLLSRWPSELEVRTESVTVGAEGITIRALVSSSEDAQRLADALKGLPGWRLDQPQTEARQDAVDVTLRFEPAREQQEDPA